jgi:hypothetical protein
MQHIGSSYFQSSHFRVIKSDPTKKVNRLEGYLAAVISDVDEVGIAKQTHIAFSKGVISNWQIL